MAALSSWLFLSECFVPNVSATASSFCLFSYFGCSWVCSVAWHCSPHIEPFHILKLPHQKICQALGLSLLQK
jgi:hypothetical protein